MWLNRKCIWLSSLKGNGSHGTTLCVMYNQKDHAKVGTIYTLWCITTSESKVIVTNIGNWNLQPTCGIIIANERDRIASS